MFLHTNGHMILRCAWEILRSIETRIREVNNNNCNFRYDMFGSCV